MKKYSLSLLLLLAIGIANNALAQCFTSPFTFGPGAITESFESTPVGVNNPVIPFLPFTTPVTPYTFASGLVLTAPSPNTTTAVIGDYAKGGSSQGGWNICNSQFYTAAPIPGGNAFLGDNNSSTGLTFSFPGAVSEVGVFVESCPGTITMTVYNSANVLIATCSRSGTGLAANWSNSFLGFKGTDIAKINISGSATLVDLLTFTPISTCNITLAKTVSHVNCFGLASGSATVSGSGGTGPYTHNWSPFGGSGATASNLTAGTYVVTVSDALNCSATTSVTITQPDPLAVASCLQCPNNHVSCNGGSNGVASVAGVGGTGFGTYSYSWNTTPVQTTPSINNLTAGTYVVTVTDGNNCTATKSFTITEPPVLNASMNASNGCWGMSNGSATVTAAGGTPAYTYSWNTTPVQTTASIANLTPGSYAVTVTDSKGCSKTASVTITEPEFLLAGHCITTGVTCHGGSDGTATAIALGGTPPYNYSWNTNPPQTGATAIGLSAGVYMVTVTDANGCTKTATCTVTQPPAFTAGIAATHINCNGNNNGAATV